jgi:PD-(D/E)XK nuclease superfamily protein
MNTDEITERIIGCAIAVSNVLGVGFLEKVYENSLAHEMRKVGLENGVIVELKVVKGIDPIHEAQLFELSQGDQCEGRSPRLGIGRFVL